MLYCFLALLSSFSNSLFLWNMIYFVLSISGLNIYYASWSPYELAITDYYFACDYLTLLKLRGLAQPSFCPFLSAAFPLCPPFPPLPPSPSPSLLSSPPIHLPFFACLFHLCCWNALKIKLIYLWKKQPCKLPRIALQIVHCTSVLKI